MTGWDVVALVGLFIGALVVAAVVMRLTHGPDPDLEAAKHGGWSPDD